MGFIPLGAKVHKSATNVNVYFVKAEHKEVSNKKKICITRSSWLNCALRDDEAVYWVSKGHYEAVAVGN